ncbi:MAG: hypothetical protein WAW86_06360 [Gammaproteobacteria bacterium]
MKSLFKAIACLCVFTLGIGAAVAKTSMHKLPAMMLAPNQTDALSPVLSEAGLPFRVVIERANFQLPVGFHSGMVGVYKGLWVFIAGRINGLHGFGLTNNFPADTQNTSIYVVNPTTGVTVSRSLNDPSSGLTQRQIDTLTVTSPQGYQEGDTVIMSGGYGVDTATGTFGTKSVLTSIYLPGIVDWVMQPGNPSFSVAKNISQIYNSIFQITGGDMFKLGNVTQLVFGQNFDGQYTTNSNGNYSDQVRQFQIKNVGGQLSVDIYNSKPNSPNQNYRRRDLNVVPVLLNNRNTLQYGLVAYSGVFTLDSGVWTVPVVIDGTNDPVMADPNLPATFKQAMNQYVCATANLYSRKYSSMYHVFFGGISYGFYSNGTFQTDSEIPFINQVTTVKMDKNGNFTQHLMSNQYPVIPSTGTNPGNPLLFGAGAYFLANNLSQYPNGVINLDSIRQSTVLGYIVGGIQSTVPNTSTNADSSASPYVFKVTLVPTATRGTAGQSSNALSLAHVEQPAQQNLRLIAHLGQKYNHKYHESASQPVRQSRLPA